MTREWLHVPEIARRWGVATDTVRANLFVRQEPDEAIPEGKLPAIKIGRQFLVHETTIKNYERLAMPWLDTEPPTQRDVGKVKRVGRNRNQLVAAGGTDHIGD